MAELVPLKAVYDGSSICGLSELRDGDVVGVEHGGLGVCTLASNTLLIGNGQGAISTTSAMTTNGQIIIAGSSGPQLTNLTGTSNEIEIADGDGAITIGLPSTVQISTNLKTPAFSITDQYCLPIADGSAGQIMCTDGSGALSFIDFDGSGHCIAFSGTTVADRTCLNFLGGGVTVSDNSGTNATDITIPVTTPELKVRNTAGCELSIELENTAIGGELVCDTTPQLGGTLDVNGYGITSVSNGNISITPNGSGSVVLDGLSWPQADGTAGYILCTDGSGSLSWATDAAGGSAAGSNNEIQYNNSGSFGASSNLTFDGTLLAAADGSQLVVGNTAVVTTDRTAGAQILGSSNDDAALLIGRFDNSTVGGKLAFVKSRNATIGGNTIVQSGDQIGGFVFNVSDGGDLVSNAAQILAKVDGTPGANDTPGRLEFWTTPDGSNTSTERIRIDSAGVMTIWSSSTAAFNPDAGTGLPSLVLHNNATDTDDQNVGIGFELGPGGSNGQARIDAVHDGTAAATDMAFSTRQSSGNLYERMRISSAGDVTLNNAGVGWQYVQGFQATTTWTDTNVTMANKAQLIMWLSYNNFNGATEGRQWGIAYCSGNGEGSVNYFRSTINVIGSNTSGWHNYGGISLREKPDSGTSAGRILQVQRSSNSSNGYFLLYKMSVAGSGF